MNKVWTFILTKGENPDIIDGQTENTVWIKRIFARGKRGGKIVRSEIVDLYNCFHIPRPAGAAAMLEGWYVQTSQAVSANRRRPAVLILPGGGYSHTSPREAEPVALRFLAKGYVPFVLHYSCGPHPFPVALREAAMAMKYIRQRSSELEVNPGMVAAIGFSAGGHLCGTLGTLFDSDEVADIGTAEEIRPDVLGLCYPVAVSWGRTHEGSFQNLTFGDEQLRARLSLDTLVRPDMPPVFLWHTRQDGSVPCRNSLILATALEEADIPFVLHIYHKGPHGLSVADEMAYGADHVPEVSWDVPGWLEAMQAFFREQGFCLSDERCVQ